MIYIRSDEIVEYKGDRMPVGIHGKMKKHFSTLAMPVQDNDVVYLFSDGYIAQFGRKKGSKFLTKNFRNLLLKINHIPMSEQKEILAETLNDWKGFIPQIEDILVIGFRIN